MPLFFLNMSTNKPVEVNTILGELISLPDKKWLVIRTKSRHEKKVADYAFNANIHYYLPLQDSEKIYQNRKIVFTKPLFSGYIFAHCDFKEKQTLVISGHVAHFLHVINEQELLDELRSIYFGNQREAVFRETEYLESGTRVQIVAGKLAGLTGYVKDQSNLSEVVLQVNLLHQAVAVTVNPSHVKII
ncbi:MAG TPA: transcription termination/antitermination NusG family protein [Candidatus Cloacimonadota bacterium]|nr:transcription termination/antitermination NusG family protein [Candidatus Cloacimonadota bacterium]